MSTERDDPSNDLEYVPEILTPLNAILEKILIFDADELKRNHINIWLGSRLNWAESSACHDRHLIQKQLNNIFVNTPLNYSDKIVQTMAVFEDETRIRRTLGVNQDEEARLNAKKALIAGIRGLIPLMEYHQILTAVEILSLKEACKKALRYGLEPVEPFDTCKTSRTKVAPQSAKQIAYNLTSVSTIPGYGNWALAHPDQDGNSTGYEEYACTGHRTGYMWTLL